MDRKKWGQMSQNRINVSQLCPKGQLLHLVSLLFTISQTIYRYQSNYFDNLTAWQPPVNYLLKKYQLVLLMDNSQVVNIIMLLLIIL